MERGRSGDDAATRGRSPTVRHLTIFPDRGYASDAGRPGEIVASRPISEIKAELFKALAHPRCIRVLEILRADGRTVGELALLTAHHDLLAALRNGVR